MAFSTDEIERHLSTLERAFWSHRRPPQNLRNQIREGQRLAGQSIELFFNRPSFNDPNHWIEESIAKVTYVRSSDAWKLYWKRADLKWHAYPPRPKAKTLEQALSIIHEDANCCFFG